MINGAHGVLYSQDAAADRAFLRDFLGLPNVDAGDGWLIFGLPPSEVAVHPAPGGGRHELFFLCEQVEALVGELTARGVTCSAIEEFDWGRLTRVALPGGSDIGIYEARHGRPPSPP